MIQGVVKRSGEATEFSRMGVQGGWKCKGVVRGVCVGVGVLCESWLVWSMRNWGSLSNGHHVTGDVRGCKRRCAETDVAALEEVR